MEATTSTTVEALAALAGGRSATLSAAIEALGWGAALAAVEVSALAGVEVIRRSRRPRKAVRSTVEATEVAALDWAVAHRRCWAGV